MVNITDEASKVLLAVCLLKNLPWSRENTSESQFHALMAIKDAVINNSCAWVRAKNCNVAWVLYSLLVTFQLSSSLQSFSCDDLSAYCSTAEIVNVLHTTFKGSRPASCDEWITNNLGSYNDEIRSVFRDQCA